MRDEVTAFQLGSSIVITLPEALGIKPGQKMKVEKSKGKIMLKQKKITREEEVRKLVRKLSGGATLKPDLTPEEMNEELDRRYEEMLP